MLRSENILIMYHINLVFAFVLAALVVSPNKIRLAVMQYS